MNLNSKQNVILLFNCINVKLQLLESSKNRDTDYSETINLYNKILDLLRKGDTQNAINTIKYSVSTDDFYRFSEEMLNDSPKNIAEKYVNLVKERMQSSDHPFSEKKFDEFKKAFYKGNEYLIDNKNLEENISEYEEEPEKTCSSNHLTPDIASSLENLNRIIRKINPRTIDSKTFKDFSTTLRNAVKLLGIQKFQKFFNTVGQEIIDMQISYDNSQPTKPTYKTDFTLLDLDSKEKSTLTITELAPQSKFISTYYQNLCYMYLEGDKYSKIDDSLISRETIINQMNTFFECYRKLDDMSKCKVNILNNKIIFSVETDNFEPTKDLEACNSIPNQDEEHDVI